jgi:aryl-alcohol dehydrogenase-like predicted oxidoreductase
VYVLVLRTSSGDVEAVISRNREFVSNLQKAVEQAFVVRARQPLSPEVSQQMDSDERPQLCIAWLLSREPAVVPLAGSSKRKWLDENAKAADLRPSEATLAALDKAFEPGVARGDRYPAPMMARLGL